MLSTMKDMKGLCKDIS